jgi:site-specific recombinase XerD
MAKKRLGNITRNMTWEDLLKQFISEKEAQGRSERTVQDYKYHMKQFYAKYPDGDLKTNLYSYLAEKCAPATFNLRLMNLKPFLQYAVVQGFIAENPLANITRRKVEPRIVLVESDILSRLLSLPDISTYPGLRDKAMIYLTIDTGIRPKEACHLSTTDFNNRVLEVLVRAENAKTRTQRILPISQITASLITRLIAVRPVEWTEKIPLFASADGTILNKNTWGDRMEKYSKKLGAKIRPYDLRHVFALGFLRNGGNALFLQRIMGHSDLSMTKRYIAASSNDLKTAHQSASPLLNLIKPKRIGKII